ncbi:hypothetical protein SFHH103_01430 [Sinorhizobium fredii HH103]|uniref:Uncharacterized protein n=1 Tax=Sinorhizobium fredii (strain HH103) TaxID=1117943 RepID=G9A6P8_SINF1|nr:hypothetical protein SFHH103_01430 [Sinorhizobium fredii HH103]
MLQPRAFNASLGLAARRPPLTGRLTPVVPGKLNGSPRNDLTAR